MGPTVCPASRGYLFGEHKVPKHESRISSGSCESRFLGDDLTTVLLVPLLIYATIRRFSIVPNQNVAHG
jgi:hypothetical protein